ncbi:MAG TPA: HAD-IA family hydrolase [Ktedonobacterales bacterium]
MGQPKHREDGAQLAPDNQFQARLNAGRVWLPHPQAIQAVFFDVGFTLLDPHPSFPEAVRDILARNGITVELRRLEEALPAAEAQFVETARAEPLTWSDEQAIQRIWRSYFLALLESSLRVEEQALPAAVEIVLRAFDEATTYALYPDVLPVLQVLHARGLKLGVISDWGVSLSLILRHFDLTRYFDFAVVSASVRRAKPDPGLFQLALERADVTHDYALHVGDSYVRDALGARLAGIHPVLIDRTRSLSEGTPDCPLVYDLYELLGLLDIPTPEGAPRLPPDSLFGPAD